MPERKIKISISIAILGALLGLLLLSDRISNREKANHHPIFLKRPPLQRANQAAIDKEEDRIVAREMRYQTIMIELKESFTPPKTGEHIKMEYIDGTTVEGILVSFDDISSVRGNIKIMTTNGLVDFSKQTISDKSKIKYYSADHAIYWTEKRIAEEFEGYVTPTNAWNPNDNYSSPIYPAAY